MTLGFPFNSLVYEKVSTQLYGEEELNFLYKTHSNEHSISERNQKTYDFLLPKLQGRSFALFFFLFF